MYAWADGELVWQEPRHDEVNGRPFPQPVDVEFQGVTVERGQG